MSDNRGINIKALALGVLTDFSGQLVVGSAFGLIVGIVLAAQGVPRNELAARSEGPIVLVPVLIIDFFIHAPGRLCCRSSVGEL